MSPDDGQVTPETCRDCEPQQSDSESEVCIKLVVFITKLSEDMSPLRYTSS
jgi:hypothetical protein